MQAKQCSRCVCLCWMAAQNLCARPQNSKSDHCSLGTKANRDALPAAQECYWHRCRGTLTDHKPKSFLRLFWESDCMAHCLSCYCDAGLELWSSIWSSADWKTRFFSLQAFMVLPYGWQKEQINWSSIVAELQALHYEKIKSSKPNVRRSKGTKWRWWRETGEMDIVRETMNKPLKSKTTPKENRML